MARPTLDDMLKSIANKICGSREAHAAIATCKICGDVQEPVDTGTDVDGTRLWVTFCCGKTQTYLEKPFGA